MKLYYFDIPVRGEPIRLLLHHAKVPFQDIRISGKDWKELKSSGKFPLEQVPILELENGEVLSQSIAILFYLGMKYGYMPSDLELHYQAVNLVQGILDNFRNWAHGFLPAHFNDFSPEEIITNKKKYLDIDLPLILKILDKQVSENSKGNYLIGNQITVADFQYIPLALKFESPEIIDTFKNIISNLKYLSKYHYFIKSEFDPYYRARKSNYKVIYFDWAGEAESIRMILNYCGIKFEDERISTKDWSEKLKHSLPLEYHALPALVEDGKYFVQSQAILEKLGIKFNLFPITNIDLMTDIFIILGAVVDLFRASIPAFHNGCSEEQKDKLMKLYVNETLPLYFSKFQDRLKNNDSQSFICGSNITIADFALLGFFQAIIFCNTSGYMDTFKSILSKFPLLKTYVEKKLKDFYPLQLSSPKTIIKQ